QPPTLFFFFSEITTAATTPTSLLSIEISSDNLSPSVEAATVTLILRQASVHC
uniref:Uncharacterized protein n=1 Tax=Cucumis melo TaxID=3656 RepID=A0A9I9EBY7_CUCME